MKIAIGLAILVFTSSAMARDVNVNGYSRQDGTYVQPHHRTAPDNSLLNNYGTQGNTNPYTGQQGTVNPHTYQQPTYTQPAPTYSPQPTYQQPSQHQPYQYNQQKQCPVGVYSC